MAGKTAILSVRVVSDTRKAQQGAADTATAWEKAQGRIDKLAGAATLVGVAMVAGAKKAVDAASALEQSTGGVNAVFKQHAAEIEKFAKTTADSIGISQRETQEMATILGSQLKNMGIPMDEVSGKTIDLVKLGGDLAAMYGGTTSDAVSSLSALLRGERDPIEKYGVAIKQADINAQKTAMGLDGLTGAADKNAEMQATLALLTQQTADAHGAAAAEYDTVASAQQRLSANWEEAAAELGTALLPAVSQAATLLSDLAKWVKENDGLVLKLATGVGSAAAAAIGLSAGIKTVNAVVSVFRGVAGAVKTTQMFVAGLTSAKAAASAFTGVAGTVGGKVAALATSIGKGALAAGRWAVQTTILTAKLVAQKTAQLAISVASKAAAAAQWLWNAAANANPLILIITLIVAAIVLLVLNWDKVKAVALVVWDAIKTAALWFWDNVLVPIGEFIGNAFTLYWTTLKIVALVVWTAIKNAALAVWNWLVGVGTWISNTFTAAWTALRIAALVVWTAIKNAGLGLWNWLKSVGTWITSTFKNAWTSLKTAGISALNAIISPVRNLVGWLKDAWDWVSKLFSSGIDKLGGLFGFSARVEPGAPVTAAAGGPPSLPGLFATRSGDTNLSIKIEMPNYVGDKRELAEWLEAALAEALRRKQRMVTA